MRIREERAPLPPRLAEEREVTGTLLRRYLRQQPVVIEPLAWQRLSARLDGRAGLPVWARGFLASALATTLLVVGWRFWQHQPPAPPPVARQLPVAPPTPMPMTTPAPEPAAAAAQRPPIPLLRLRRRAVALEAGETLLPGQARVTLSSPGRARAFRNTSGAQIELQAGRIGLHVSQQRHGQRLQVVVHPYRFVVRGTRFEVTRRQGRVNLAVQEGRVDVYRGRQLRARVRAGGAWQGSLRSPTRVAAKPPPDSLPDLIACRERAGDPRVALDCYRTRASRTDLIGEVALYEAAALLRDALADPEQAIALLREHRSRFPDGTLRAEVDLSLLELAGQRGLHREVLAVSADLLAGQPQGERTGELHLLRGTAYREGLRDCARAEGEYARAAAAPGRARPEALYWRARCLEQLGRRQDAIATYRAALATPDAAHAAEARRRLSALEREHPGPSRLQGP